MSAASITKLWKDIPNNQMISFTDLKTSGLATKSGQSHITSERCIVKSQILTMYTADTSKLQSYAENQLIPKVSAESTNIDLYITGSVCSTWESLVSYSSWNDTNTIGINGTINLTDKLFSGEGVNTNDIRTSLKLYSYDTISVAYFGNPTNSTYISTLNNEVVFSYGGTTGSFSFGNIQDLDYSPASIIRFEGTIITTMGRIISISATSKYVLYYFGEQNEDGDFIAFPTSSNTCCPSCSVGVVTRGTQTWSGCNLNVTTYRDDTPLVDASNYTNQQWNDLTVGAWCYYDDDSSLGRIYGKLYNWYAVAGIHDTPSLTNTLLRKQLAPAEWHIPSDAEWTTLVSWINTTFSATATVDKIGGYLKETQTIGTITNASPPLLTYQALCGAHWSTPNTHATNGTGLTALPGGARGALGFQEINRFAQFWTSSLDGTSLPITKQLSYGNGYLWTFSEPKRNGYSVRLIYDGIPNSATASMRFKNFVDNNYDELVYGRTYYVNTKTIELPLMINGSYNFTVNWGDGSAPQIITNYNQRFHTYTTNTLNWNYTVSLAGKIEGWSYADIDDTQCLLIDYIYNWGSIKFINNISGNSSGMFYNCKNLKMDSCISAPNLGTITSLANCFGFCTKLGKIGGLENWNVSNITNMYGMFANIFPTIRSYNPADQKEYNLFNFTPQDLSNWNTSNVTDMDLMFYNCRHNNNIGGWNVSNVTTMHWMFKGAWYFNNGGSDSIKNWNTSSLEYCNSMFYDCTQFNQPLDNFNFTNVISNDWMFKNCYIFNQNLSTWERSGATMQNLTSMFFMFDRCRKFNGAVDTWNTRSLRNLQGTFHSCYEFNQPMNSWNTQSLTSAQGMLQNAFAFNQPLGNWNLSSMGYGGFSTYLSPFHGIDKGDGYVLPTRSFALQPETLRQTLLGWANTLDTGGGYIHFPSSANDGNCTGISRTSPRGPGINSKGWNIYWLDGSQTSGNQVDNGVVTSPNCPFNWNG